MTSSMGAGSLECFAGIPGAQDAGTVGLLITR